MRESHPPRRGGSRSGPRRRPSSAPSASHSDPSIAPLHPTLEPPDIRSFREWNLGDPIQGAIEAMGITTPTPIQRLAIQHVLDGRDVIAKAETGTGKTLAFGAGMMSKIDPARASVLALVLCPTRELAEQGQKVLEILGKTRGIKVALVVGGEPLEPQVAALKAGAQVVVGTPGRILDLYKQRFLSFPWTEFAVLDEADVMLEIGFIDDVKQILSYMPDERQTLLFSATFPPELLKLARAYTKNPCEIATASGVSTVDTIEQSFIHVGDDDRSLALIRLIEQSAPEDVFLVFCDRRTEVDKLMRRLERMPFSIKALHGGYDQAARFRVMSAFRTGEVKVLVATDVASRGLDVAHVTTVVNYGSPQDITDYTHRIGRTGRAGRKGRAITLVGGLDMRRWKPIQRDATWDIPEAQLPGPSRGGPRREPRRESHGERSDERRPAGRRPSFDRAPDTRREPAPSDRWPVDSEAQEPAFHHGDVRPNRESPRRPDPERRSRPSAAHAARETHSEQRQHAPERNHAPRGEHAPRRERAAQHEQATQGQHRPERERTPSREHVSAREQASRREVAQPREETTTRDRSPRREQPPREPAARRDAPPRGPVRDRASVADPDSSRRPNHAHARAEGSPERRPQPRDAREPRRESAPRPPRREERPAQRSTRPAAPTERPPGTFERPLGGGLLGQSRRAVPQATPTEPKRRPRGGRQH